MNSQRMKKERKTEEAEKEMGRQYHRMDGIEAERGVQTCGGQGRMERRGK
jgi:hypothetical protein